jgi:hypothetical protein
MWFRRSIAIVSLTENVPRALVMAGLVLVAAGCQRGDRPPLGRVTGTVTMDGQPLAGVEVSFAPESGRPSVGLTDGAGRYELMYVGTVKGAKVGSHRVRIATVPSDLDDSGDDDRPPRSLPLIRIPLRYNFQTTLTAEVQRGRNTFDFALESK